jgi:phosphoribosylaminoimidazole-succinocarboxamide synthase
MGPGHGRPELGIADRNPAVHAGERIAFALSIIFCSRAESVSLPGSPAPLTKSAIGLESITRNVEHAVTIQSSDSILLRTDFPDLPLHVSGKVRDVYRADSDRLLFVATDRISAFDYVLASGIPCTGRVLTQLSLFWFNFLKDVITNHLVTADVNQYPEPIRKYADELRGRSMLVMRAAMYPVECVVRGYLCGSGWKEYQQKGSVCGISLPAGMRESDKLPEPIFTPATKAASGHDENISFDEMVKHVGSADSETLREVSLRIYNKAADYALTRGIIIADTKLEFGFRGSEVPGFGGGNQNRGTAEPRNPGTELTLIDEILTPDSSRFWPRDQYRPGAAQPSFDKQFVRDYLERIGWNKQPPVPTLPDEVVMKTREKYLEAYRLLTGRELREPLGAGRP